MPGPGSRACPKSRPSLLDKRDKKRAELAEERRVRAAVKKREGGLCRVCVLLAIFPIDDHVEKVRRGTEMHHIVSRSLGGRHTTKNCIWVCHRHHQERHAGVIGIQGDGDGAIRVERLWQ